MNAPNHKVRIYRFGDPATVEPKYTREVNIEAVLLTGGASRRMGEDKAGILVGGVPQAKRIAFGLKEVAIPVTVLGRLPIDGCRFLADEESFAGPLSALGRFEPSADAVFVCACDLPRFDAALVNVLRLHLGDHEAVVPDVNGWKQPLCALYAARAFTKLTKILDEEGSCAMKWLDSLDLVLVAEHDLARAGLNPLCAQGANTREELDSLYPRTV